MPLLPFVFSACSQENKTSETETASANDIGGATMTSGTQATNQATTTDSATATLQNQASGQATAAGMNPPHGEPGHDCSIPVGAPLNSAPDNQPKIKNAEPVLNNTAPAGQSASPVFNAPAQTKSTAGLNPAHGEPGHDCSIPVGAPLKKIRLSPANARKCNTEPALLFPLKIIAFSP